jgi:hypothetical protein
MLTLLFDNNALAIIKQIWSIYYHWKIDDSSHSILNSQLKKLISISSSYETWHSSPYGGILEFADLHTLRQVREVWEHCLLSSTDAVYQFNLEHAKLLRASLASQNVVNYTGIRNASPLGLEGLADIQSSHEQYHEHGGVFENEQLQNASRTINRTFFATGPRPATLHYGSDPLLGFHTATAYAPLMESSPLNLITDKNAQAARPLLAAHSQLRAWCVAFQEAAKTGTVIRYSCSDALALCHTLQLCNERPGCLSANLKVHSSTFEDLILDERVYGHAPRKFDTIDTSNLADHIGPLNLLLAAGPLLKDRLSSSLNMAFLVNRERGAAERLASLLCGDISTVGLLLGLGVVETWTNATAIADVNEAVLHAITSPRSDTQDQGRIPNCSRFTWKRLACMSSFVRPRFNNSDLVRFCRQIYENMFTHESIFSRMQASTIQGFHKLSNPFYTRSAYAALLKVSQDNVEADWKQVLGDVVAFISTRESTSVSNDYAQEMVTWLHLVGVHTVNDLSDPFNLPATSYSTRLPGKGKEPPAIICVTVLVPRSKLQFLFDVPFTARGIPLLRASITDGVGNHGQRVNDYGAVQTGFGKIIKNNHSLDSDNPLLAEEDHRGIHGSESLACSFFVPTWTLAHEKDVRISIRLQNTLLTEANYKSILGEELVLFETQLSNESTVFLSMTFPQSASSKLRQGPNAPQHLSLPVFAGANWRHSAASLDTTTVMTILLKNDSIAVDTISYRINVDGPHKTSLAKRETAVTMRALGAMTIEVTIGSLDTLITPFPRPIVTDRVRLRVARKSSYVELVAPVIELPSQNEYPGMVFPISLDKCSIATPVCWTMPYINLNKLPLLDHDKKPEMQWLITHCSSMFSTRERAIKQTSINGTSSGNVRVDFKEVIHSMMMGATGLQGPISKVYSLGDEVNCILIFIASLKLDLANRTVILDAAMLPMPKASRQGRLMESFEATRQEQAVVQVPLTEADRELWNAILPAFAERCRTWVHNPQTCEYIIDKSIPRKVTEIGQSPLCSCGRGKVPEDFVQDAQSPYLNEVLTTYGHRIAISPCFVLPYIEDIIPEPRESLRPTGSLTTPAATTKNIKSSASLDRLTDLDSCGHCGKSERTLEDGAKKSLLRCKRCKLMKYCSVECQKNHWKVHKGFCKEIAQAAEGQAE